MTKRILKLSCFFSFSNVLEAIPFPWFSHFLYSTFCFFSVLMLKCHPFFQDSVFTTPGYAIFSTCEFVRSLFRIQGDDKEMCIFSNPISSLTLFVCKTGILFLPIAGCLGLWTNITHEKSAEYLHVLLPGNLLLLPSPIRHFSLHVLCL